MQLFVTVADGLCCRCDDRRLWLSWVKWIHLLGWHYKLTVTLPWLSEETERSQNQTWWLWLCWHRHSHDNEIIPRHLCFGDQLAWRYNMAAFLRDWL